MIIHRIYSGREKEGNMKFSMCTAVFGMHDLHDTIRRAAEIGFDAVEITAAKHLPVESTKERRAEVKGWLDEAGIACSGLHYIWDGSVKLATKDKEQNEKACEYLCKVIDVAADLDAKTVIVGSGGATRHLDDEADREEAAKCVAEVLRRAGDYAQTKDVYLAVEAINRYETNFLNTMQEATEFVEMVNHPHVCTMADTYHINIEETDPAGSIRKYGYALQNLHLADSNRCAPGTGHIDFDAIAAALLESGFDKYCSFEVFGLYPWKLWFDSADEAERQMRIGLQTAKAAFARAEYNAQYGPIDNKFGETSYEGR